MTAQTCRICNDTFPLTPEFFGPEPNCANGYRRACNSCRAEEKRAYYAANAPEIRERARRRRAERAAAFRTAGIYDAA
jgi:hypothetical protein